MGRTLGEWEQLWRERWDINDYADLDQVFADTEDCKDVVCEVEIILGTQEGRIETVQISLLDSEFTVLADYEYSIFELGRVELVQEVIAPLTAIRRTKKLKRCQKASRKSQYVAPSGGTPPVPFLSPVFIIVKRLTLYSLVTHPFPLYRC